MNENIGRSASPRYHRLSLFDFIDRDTVESLLSHVVDAVKIPVFVQEPMARQKFFASDLIGKPGFCKCLENDKDHLAECQSFLTKSVHESVTYGRPFVGACPYGLTFAFGPLILKRGACTAALVAGYARTSEPQDVETLIEQLASNDCELDTVGLKKAYQEIPQIDSIKLHAVADMLCTVAEFIMKLVPIKEDNFEDFLNSDMAVARNLIHDFYKDDLESKPVISSLNKTGKFEGDEEAKLIQAVALGQRSVAEIMLRDILDKLLIIYQDNTLALKGHIMELAVLISRAPLFQVSYSEGEAFSLNHLPSVNPPKGTNYLILKNWVLTVLSESLDIIERKQNSDVKAKVIREVLSFINSNLYSTLRIEEIANAVSFSSQHLTRIFLEEMGMTIRDYIVQARIEEAKCLLSTSSYNISQIAERLNFYDSTYFAKVFKKKTGFSPMAYRKEYRA